MNVSPTREPTNAGPLVDGLAGFSRRRWPDKELRAYQREPARAILDSVERRDGTTFCLIFSRQSGKDELVAQVMAYLLHQHAEVGGSIVLVAPTFNPQAVASRDRLVARLRARADELRPRTREGRIVEIGEAAAYFFSAASQAQVRGATASLLLLCNEAQHVDIDTWDSEFDPMAVSTNATTVFFGTPWSNDSLLARQMAYCAALEAADGRQRVFRVDWKMVAAEVPVYGQRVEARIAQLGARHAFIRTEYMLEGLDGAGGLFDAARRALLQGDHERQRRPTPGLRYALLIDVAGEEEEEHEATPGGRDWGANQRRDATALTVVEVIAPRTDDPLLNQSSYRVVDRHQWIGVKHVNLYHTIRNLAEHTWRAEWVVIDATGVGAGLSSFLKRAFGRRCHQVTFTTRVKSDIGWAYTTAIDTGRVKEYRDDDAKDTRRFWQQVRECTYSVHPGPEHYLRWSVPSTTLHDDLLVSAALIGWLDTNHDMRRRVARGGGGG